MPSRCVRSWALTEEMDVRPQFPRVVATLVIAAIALASASALLWPQDQSVTFSGPTEVGVIRRVMEASSAAPRIGAVAPDFEWNAADGKTQRLSDLRGGIVVINFWATWCVPCRAEMPALQRVAASSGATVLAVDLREDGAKVRSFLDSLGLDRLMPLLDLDGEVARRYDVIALPETFFIDASGVVRHIERGQMLDDDTIWKGIMRARQAR